MNVTASAVGLLLALELMIPGTQVYAQAQSQAQGAAPQVSVINLQVVNNANGTQSVITPKGDLASLIGAGVAGNVAQIYVGAQGGFWYTDKTGKTIDLYPSVQELQSRRGQNQAPQPVPQYAPNPYYEEPQQQQSTQQSSSSGGRAGSGLVTAAAAGLGAAAGSAMSSRYYNAPYGSPMYYGANGNGYYYHNGDRRELDDLNSNQKAVLYNKHQTNQQQQAQALEHRQSTQQARLDSRSTNQQNRQSSAQQSQAFRQASGGQAHDFQRQQQFYQQQGGQRNGQFHQQAGNNPFAAQGGGERASRGGRAGGFSRGEGGFNRAEGGFSRGGGGRAMRGGGGRRR